MNQLATIENKGDKKSLLVKFADRYSVDANKMMETLKATAFNQGKGAPPSNEQMLALLVVADQYKLNPFTKEIYAFPDKHNGIVPVVGVDGWSRIINSHPDFDGMEFTYSEETTRPTGAQSDAHVWVECSMYRKDRSRPIVIREYLDEVYKQTSYASPWQTHPKRFHRHKTMIQCARLAFGFVGIYDQDEADRISDQKAVEAEYTVQHERKAVIQQLPVYSGEKFEEDFPLYSKAIAEEAETADEIISMIETKYTMNEDQKQVYRDLQSDISGE
tara:strand:- start:10253 stop:11074 length:822 start_codon:yes stop_codon:yes gene_type:complete